MTRWRGLLLALAVLFTVGLAQAEERITSFESEISIRPDSTMFVRETIEVVALGHQIQRGIYRDFPTTYKDAVGNVYEVGFQVARVKKGTMDEPFHLQRLDNGVRVYIGSGNVFLNPGTYRYQIEYETNRQLGFFETHDELYWNVTGNGWAFPIEQSSARITLPGKGLESDVKVEGYTGHQGSTERAFDAGVHSSGAWIHSTRSLQPGEGLTVVVQFPKGVVTPPSLAQRLYFYARDNAGTVLMLLALAVSGIYLFLAWLRVGRDPDPGVVYTRYDPPDGISPAAARYISRMGYDDTTFSAAILNLAVKGHLKIISSDGTYQLVRTSSDKKKSLGEDAFYEVLLAGRDSISLKNKHHAIFSDARRRHREALARSCRKIYFKKNATYVFPSVAVSVALTLAAIFAGSFTLMSFLVLAANIVLHIAFLRWLKAPTARGRLLLDELDGFKLYLSVAEKDELSLKHPPEKTPELFEKYLPFAVALQVENAWEAQFTEVFARLTEGLGGHQAHWYRGPSMGRAGFAAGLSKGFSSAISSAAVAPGSASGGSSGGGGFSGGGGGGGGGGGW